MENKISDYGAIDFLCFYLLGVTQADIGSNGKEDELLLLSKCANRAYLDLNRTLKFKKVPEEDKENYQKLQEQKSKFRKDISKIIVDRITNLLNEEPQDYEAWHEETCNKVIEKAQEYEQDNWLQKNGDKGFYYGQAQKWVNMTIKYMRVTEKWKDKLDKLMNVLHIPVDSYILQGVWDDEHLELEDKEDILKQVSKKDVDVKARLRLKKNFNDQWFDPWSKWEEDQYISFQKNLRNKLNNNQFAWEGKTWIEIAKKRNKKEESKQNDTCSGSAM